MNAIGSVTPIISTPIAGAVLQNDVSATVFHVATELDLIVPPKLPSSKFELVKRILK